jgi:hypothetical protein
MMNKKERQMNKNIKPVLVISCLLLLSLSTISGCNNSNVVESIKLLPISQSNAPPLDGMFWQINPGPHPTVVQGSFLTGDEMQLGLVISMKTKSISFSKYVFYNDTDKSEEPVPTTSSQLGPFEPAVHLIGPWQVPTTAGEYEFRVYSGAIVVASAKFVVA